MKRLIDEVDPFIGTDGAGNCLPGPYLPFSMVRVGPDVMPPHPTSGYSSKAPLQGFSHLHVSGTGGAGRYGNVQLVPLTGHPRIAAGPRGRSDERAEPGYYRVTLEPDGVEVELTSTPRCGLHRYRFPKGESAHVLIDLGACVQRGEREPVRGTGGSIGGFIEWVSDRELIGRGDYAGGWGHDFPYSVYFVVRFDQPVLKRRVAIATGLSNGLHAFGPQVKAIASFANQRTADYWSSGAADADLNAPETDERSDCAELLVRVGISFTSIAQARTNLDRELSDRSFDEIRTTAASTWESMLDRLRVTGGTDEQRTLFYTMLTRLLCQPGDLGIDEENPLWQSGVRQFNDYYCLWDSVRAANQLIALIDPEMHVAMMNSLLDIADHIGWMPDAWTAFHSAQVQGGSSADILLCESKLKGFTGIDYEKALRYMRHAAENPSENPFLRGRYEVDFQAEHGYVPDNVINCVSRHLEYRYQDWCIAQLAAQLGQPEVAADYLAKAENLWQLWREDMRWFGPKNRAGAFIDPFDPIKTVRPDAWNDPYFYEGPSSHWTWSAHQDFAGLVARMGGAEAFIERLDWLFDSGNFIAKETVLHAAWLYHYAGRPDLSVKRAREVMAADFKPIRQGLTDNEDMGAQSSFYLWSSIGMYPVMGQDLYLLGAPVFEKVELTLGSTSVSTAAPKLIIEAPGAGPQRPCIAAATLDGKPLTRAWLRHAEIATGATLRYELSESPTDWATTEPPPSPMERSEK